MRVTEIVIGAISRIREQRNPPTPEDCDHKDRHGISAYDCVYEGYDSETWKCTKCGDRYKLYDDEMR